VNKQTYENERLILAYFVDDDRRGYESPSVIGVSVTGDEYKRSSWASPKLLKMVARGLFRRNDKGLYQLTPKGRAYYKREFLGLVSALPDDEIENL